MKKYYEKFRYEVFRNTFFTLAENHSPNILICCDASNRNGIGTTAIAHTHGVITETQTNRKCGIGITRRTTPIATVRTNIGKPTNVGIAKPRSRKKNTIKCCSKITPIYIVKLCENAESCIIKQLKFCFCRYCGQGSLMAYHDVPSAGVLLQFSISTTVVFNALRLFH